MNSALPHDWLRVGVKLRPRFMKMSTFHDSHGISVVSQRSTLLRKRTWRKKRTNKRRNDTESLGALAYFQYFPCMQVIQISFTCHQLNQTSFMFQDLKTITLASYHPYPSYHFPVPGRQQPPGSTRTAVLLSFTENLAEFF